MKFCVPVIGDAHLRNDSRQPDREAALRQIVRECKASPIPIGLWGVPGDLHDAGSDVQTRNLWAEILLEMADVAPVVIEYGNHDRDKDLDIYAKLRGRHQIYVIERPQVVRVQLAPSQYAEPGPPMKIAVAALPYPNPAGFVASGIAPADVVPHAYQQLDIVMMMLGGELEQARRSGLPTLFLFHANVSGSRASTGQPLVGQELELTESMLLRLDGPSGTCPKIGSHIHLPQEIGGAVEVGSICRLSFGEMEEKRYIVVEYSTDGFVEIGTSEPAVAPNRLIEPGRVFLDTGWQWRITSHPITVAPMAHVEARFSSQITDAQLLTGLSSGFTFDIQPEQVPAGADVRIRVTYDEAERRFWELGRPVLEAAFGHARRLQIEPVCLAHERGLRAPEVIAAKTTPEKMRAWCAAINLPIPDGLDDGVVELETRDGDELVADYRKKMKLLEEDGDA